MPQVYAVHELTTYLRELLETSPVLADVLVAGEVSNVNRPASGHVYFTLKDDAAQLRCVAFSKRYGPPNVFAKHIQDGNAILAHGRVAIYEARGDLQLYVDFVQPEGAGALWAEFERLRTKLEQEGLFEEARKRALPRYPRRIGVVTSPTGAVFQDICHVLERRWPLAEIVLAPAPVQGLSAVAGIVGGIEQLNAEPDIDVMIVGRGGGGAEELVAFNNEHVARAIFASRVPVVSAVGHETDITIADFVADRRAPTPSAAAEIVAPDRRDATIRLGIAAGTMHSVLQQALGSGRAALRAAGVRIERRTPDLNRERQRSDDLARRALDAAGRAQREASHNVGSCVWRLRSLDPFATLDRGYALIQRGEKVVSSVGDARPGEKLGVRVKDGAFGVRVDGAEPAQRRRPKRSVPDAQAPLFTMPSERV